MNPPRSPSVGALISQPIPMSIPTGSSRKVAVFQTVGRGASRVPDWARPLAAPRGIVREAELQQLQDLNTAPATPVEAAAVTADVASATWPTADDDDLEELNADTFWPIIKAQPCGRISVVMTYTSTCMACAEVKPMLVQWKKEMGGEVGFYKFALTLQNKARALELNVKTSPCFMIFKGPGRLDTLRGKNHIGMVKKIVLANK